MGSSGLGNGKVKPEGNCRYQARDGLYYNGYLGSFDHLEDDKPNWDKCVKKISDKLMNDILKDIKMKNEYAEATIDFLSINPPSNLTKEFLTRVFEEYRADIIQNCIEIIGNSDVDATGRGVDELYEYLRKGSR